MISKESVIGSLVERDDTDILGRMALKLDRKQKNDWKGLALQLSVPQRVLRNFGSHQHHNSSLMLLKYIPIFDPELTLEHLKGCLVSIGRQDAVEILENAGIPGITSLPILKEHFKYCCRCFTLKDTCTIIIIYTRVNNLPHVMTWSFLLRMILVIRCLTTK